MIDYEKVEAKVNNICLWKDMLKADKKAYVQSKKYWLEYGEEEHKKMYPLNSLNFDELCYIIDYISLKLKYFKER